MECLRVHLYVVQKSYVLFKNYTTYKNIFHNIWQKFAQHIKKILDNIWEILEQHMTHFTQHMPVKIFYTTHDKKKCNLWQKLYNI